MNTPAQHPISIHSYSYELPQKRIAKYPLAQRDSSKLLCYQDGNISQDVFKNISQHLPPFSLLVYNNTKVIQARMIFQKQTGANIEVFCLEPHQPTDYALSLNATGHCSWKCMIGNKKKWKEGRLSQTIISNQKQTTLYAAQEDNDGVITFSWDNPQLTFSDILLAVGELPIPPYLHRQTEEKDKTTYQTIYAQQEGSVAAPTAGLHFTPSVLHTLADREIETTELTLHVGAGTFKPVQTEDIHQHQMHTERIWIEKATVEKIIQHIDHIVAVGTTSVRTLESLYYIGCNLLDGTAQPFFVSQWQPYTDPIAKYSTQKALQALLDKMQELGVTHIEAETAIMLKEGYLFRIVKAMITNFHQPHSTLLLLIAAFVGNDWKRIYQYALDHDFRFLSYGDSSLLYPNPKNILQ